MVAVGSYAIMKMGGKQYRVSPGDLVRVEKIPGEVGETVTLTQVHLVSDGKEVKVGYPEVGGARVECEIVAQGRGKKVIVFKMKRRKDYRRKQGHRQSFTALKVKNISLD